MPAGYGNGPAQNVYLIYRFKESKTQTNVNSPVLLTEYNY